MPTEKTLESLRKQHPRFIYQSFDWQFSNQTLTISFDFLLEPTINFQPQITITNLDKKTFANIPQEIISHWVFNMGMIELFSYWKVAASPEIVIQPLPLSPEQLSWWQELLLDGMGEYFYTNNIDFTQPNFVKFTNQKTLTPQQLPSFSFQAKNKALVPVGGGKDSALVINLLSKYKLPYEILLSYPQSPAAHKIASETQVKIIEIKRTFAPELLELNKQGYLNGHTPFSARLAFESSLVALLSGHKNILLANEFSANEGNVPYLGTMVNHQYSKSFAFENKFRAYVTKYLGSAPEYLSLLRPLTELQIAALFSRNQQFHSVFRSCNRGQQQNRWCGECPKCLFVFTVLYPFIDEQKLINEIFSENLFEKPAMNKTAQELMGLDANKPFECVGTHEETQAAFYLSIKKWQKNHPNKPLPLVLEKINNEILDQVPNLAQTSKMLLCFWNEQHNLDANLIELLQQEAQQICQAKNSYF
ncbi:MAG: hypothetical protein ACOZAK_01340 [Patescibacteria group bacterium]